MPVNKILNEVFQISFEKFGSVVYVIKLGKDNILIDTSSEENGQELLNGLEKLKINPRDVHIVLLTHRHYDHVGNLYMFPNAKIYDEKNIDELNLMRIRSIRVPGHTKDSLAFLYKNILFSGDTLFHLGIGRTDLKESAPEKMQESLGILKKINYDILCPGHV
jgi:glyoxylase-like metal-dependent hydrolase (beta-lactamase superfamily II)